MRRPGWIRSTVISNSSDWLHGMVLNDRAWHQVPQAPNTCDQREPPPPSNSLPRNLWVKIGFRHRGALGDLPYAIVFHIW
jgi:hypothetical protein